MKRDRRRSYIFALVSIGMHIYTYCEAYNTHTHNEKEWREEAKRERGADRWREGQTEREWKEIKPTTKTHT